MLRTTFVLSRSLVAAVALLGVGACNPRVTGGSTGGSGGTGGHPECSKNADCDGPYPICRKPSGTCASLTTDLCTTVMGTSPDAYKDDDAVVFGSILPTVGPDAALGLAYEGAIALALDDFGMVGGLPAPGGGASRPIVVVGCNDGPNEDQTDAAAKHLVDDLGVPAIIGYAFSGSTIKIATDVAIPAGVLLFSPSATSDAISNLADSDLVWRTSPPDSLQATAMAKYFPTVEKAARARYGLSASAPLKVAIVHATDPYGVALSSALEAQLVFNGAPALGQLGGAYQSIAYDAASTPAAIAQAAAFAPQITLLFGFNEVVDPILTGIEAQWQDATHRSFFVLADGGEVTDLWAKAIMTEDLRTRVTGTVPGVTTSYAPFASFRAAWLSSPYAQAGSPDLFGMAGAYDILYMLAYSAVAVGADPLTGQNLVGRGLRNMVPTPGAPKVLVGPAQITGAFATLAASTPIDFDGASGQLDFDKHGEAASDIQIWCVPPGSGAPAGEAINSTMYYDAATGSLAGSYASACALPTVP